MWGKRAMKSPVVWATVLFVLLMAAFLFLVGPEDKDTAYGSHAGAPYDAAPVK
jgi:hypothetical protein